MAEGSALRVAVLVSGGGSTLENLLQRIRDGRLRRVVIPFVVSSRSDVRGIEVAQSAEVPFQVLRRRDFADDERYGAAIAAALDAVGVDLVAMGGFLAYWALPARYEGRTINVHPALLPEFGGRGMYGRRVHEAVLASGAATSGCTVHLVDREYDHGPIVAQRSLAIEPGETPTSLDKRVRELEQALYPDVIQQAADQGVGWLQGAARAFSADRPAGID